MSYFNVIVTTTSENENYIKILKTNAEFFYDSKNYQLHINNLVYFFIKMKRNND